MNLTEIQKILSEYYPSCRWETPRPGIRYMIGKNTTMIITGSEIVIRPNDFGSKSGMAKYDAWHCVFESDVSLIPALQEFERREA